MLEPLKKWYCDKCGELIEKPEDGYVQFKKIEQNGIILYDDFVVVHHKSKSPLKDKLEHGCYIYNSDVTLKRFLGDDGKIHLLTLLDIGKYHNPEFTLLSNNIRKWIDLFMRFQVPYYEEARRYLDKANSDGIFDGAMENYMYLPNNLKKVIEYYQNKEL